MKNAKKVNRILALFMLCCVLGVVFLPFFVYSESRAITIHKLYNLSHRYYYKIWKNGVSHTNSNIYAQGSIDSNVSSIYINTSLTVGNSYTIQIQDTNTSTYYRASIDYNGNTLMNYGSSVTVSNPTNVFYDIYITNSTLSSSFSNYFIIANGYTLTFDSQGGSSIAAESGVTDVILGDSTGYFPQYIPTRSGYEFLGWSFTPGGTYVREVNLDADTTIYANWRINDGWTDVYFPDNSTIQMYIEGMIECPSHIAVRNGHTFSLYYYRPTLQNNDLFFNEWNITEQLQESTVTETVTASLYDDESHIYKLDLTVYGNDITVSPKIYSPHTCKLRWDSSIDNYIYVTDDIGAEFSNGEYCPYYTYDGLHLILKSQYPYFYCRFMLYEDSSSPADLTSYLRQYGNYDDSIDRYVYNIYINSPDDCVLLVYSEAIDMDYDPNDPVVSFDESGDAHWIVSAETSFMDVDWDGVYSIIPSDFNGILGTIFNLRGLAIIGTICFTAAFAIWFVRRGG